MSEARASSSVTRTVAGGRSAKAEERRRALLEAATAEFMAKGYEKTTLENIIARAGGSRSTIYKEFQNKAQLFQAIGLKRSEDLINILIESWDKAGSVRDALRRYAYEYVKAILEPSVMRLHKSGLIESEKFPELAVAFFRTHADGVSKPVADYLRHLDETGELNVADPEMAATLFIAMAKSNFQLRVLVNPDRITSRVEIERHVNFAVDMFLGGLESCATRNGRG